MKIECILHRPGGTVVELPGKTYHFAPQDDGKHIAEVTIEAHIERFLAIPEAYRLVRTAGEDAQAVFVPAENGDEPDVPVVDVELKGSKAHPNTFEINGQAYSIDQIIERAFQDSGLDAMDWNDLDDETRATKIDIVLDGIADGEIEIDAADGLDEDGNDDREELKAMYLAKFGKDAGRLSTKRIKAALEKGE